MDYYRNPNFHQGEIVKNLLGGEYGSWDTFLVFLGIKNVFWSYDNDFKSTKLKMSTDTILSFGNLFKPRTIITNVTLLDPHTFQ